MNDEFFNELQKEASLQRLRGALGAFKRVQEPGFAGSGGLKGDLVELGRRIRHPVKGFKAGLRDHFTPRGNRDRGEWTKGIREGLAKEFGVGKGRTIVPKSLRRGEHLLPESSQGLSFAEKLSRAGITGQSRATKYLPVGTGTVSAGFLGLTAAGAEAEARNNPDVSRPEAYAKALASEAAAVGTGGLGLGVMIPTMLATDAATDAVASGIKNRLSTKGRIASTTDLASDNAE